jgi:septal ring factor EnvC (AmiA/AmiB activator)
MKQLLLIMPLVALLFLVGCTAQDQPSSEREEFQRQMESQLDEFDQRIEEARNRAEELPADSRAQLEQTIDRLEERRADLAAGLEEMKAASDEEWEAFKTELEQASQDLQQAFANCHSEWGEASEILRAFTPQILPASECGFISLVLERTTSTGTPE